MTRKFPLTSGEFKQIYSKVPKLCVEVVLQVKEGVVLTLRQHESWNNTWHLPGGTLYYRESVEDAVHRVARDELEIEVKIKELLGYIEHWDEEEKRGFGYSVTLPFLCTTDSVLPTQNKEGEEIKVFHTIPKKIISAHRDFLKVKFGFEDQQ